jgi:tRNA-Thr(GGU) m(6)t(6)A37 methyltransferase TsaA
MKIHYEPIGIVHSPFKQTAETPTQPTRSQGVLATVEIYQKYTEGLTDLDKYEYIILLCHLHLVREYRLKLVPFRGTELRGLFSTRAPCRPNPIALSVVKLLKVDGNLISIKGIDLIDGTPVLDIKPYFDDLLP